MKKLFDIAQKQADEFEVYSTQSESTSLEFSASEFNSIDSSIMSGSSIRLIKDQKLGFGYTRNIIDPELFVKNAVDSLAGNVEARYNLPEPTKITKLNNVPDKSIVDISNDNLIEECQRICAFFDGKTNAEVGVYAGKGIDKLSIANSHGVDLKRESAGFYLYVSLVYPGGAAGISRVHSGKKWSSFDNKRLQELLDLYNATEQEIDPKQGKMKVLFMPASLYALTWRIDVGLSGKSIYEKISPIAEKQGEKLFSEKLTIYDDPLNDSIPGSIGFDDEGVAKSKMMLFDRGILKNFYYDLDYANKLGVAPTGHGFRSGRWGGGGITVKPSPSLSHLRIQKGQKSLKEMIGMIDRGIILEGVMGAHSGNIPNGDFSVGVSPAFYVENGEIKGRIKDAMVAGNIYETLQNVVEVQNDWEIGRNLPAILCDDVFVATKG